MPSAFHRPFTGSRTIRRAAFAGGPGYVFVSLATVMWAYGMATVLDALASTRIGPFLWWALLGGAGIGCAWSVRHPIQTHLVAAGCRNRLRSGGVSDVVGPPLAKPVPTGDPWLSTVSVGHCCSSWYLAVTSLSADSGRVTRLPRGPRLPDDGSKTQYDESEVVHRFPVRPSIPLYEGFWAERAHEGWELRWFSQLSWVIRCPWRSDRAQNRDVLSILYRHLSKLKGCLWCPEPRQRWE